MLILSIVANCALLIVGGYLMLRYQTAIRSEKLATFSGCLSAMVNGLGHEEPETRFDRTALSLSAMSPGIDKDKIRLLLIKAALIRMYRGSTTLQDVGGEHVKQLLLASATEEQAAEKVWARLSTAIDSQPEFKPRDEFGDEVLARAQLEFEAKIFAYYSRALPAFYRF